MKNATRLFLFSMLGMLLFSSCSTMQNMSITKRHYRSGFYVDLGSSKRVLQKSSIGDRTPAEKIETTKPAIANEATANELKLTSFSVSRKVPAISLNSEKVAQRHKLRTHTYASVDKNVAADAKESIAFWSEVAPVNSSELNESRSHSSNDIPFWLLILLTILIPPLGVAIKFGIVDKFWISLALTLLFFIPGLIYSLIVVLQD